MPSHTPGKMCVITTQSSWRTWNMPTLPGRTGRPFRSCGILMPVPPLVHRRGPQGSVLRPTLARARPVLSGNRATTASRLRMTTSSTYVHGAGNTLIAHTSTRSRLVRSRPGKHKKWGTLTPWTQQAPTSVSVADHLHTFTDLDLLDYPSDPLPELSHLKPVNAPNPIPYLAPSPLPISPSAGLACDIASLYNAVHSQGIPNFCGARIPVSHQLNIPTWRHYADRFDDPDLIDFLEFGFPLSYVLSAMPWPAQTNHASATCHPTHIDHYVATELGYGTLQGPFDHPHSHLFFKPAL